MKKLIVTGASGFLGWNLCLAAKSEWDVIGIGHSHDISDFPAPLLSFDLCEINGVTRLLEKIRPHAVIHAAAQADPNFCQMHPEQTARINVEASENIARLCARFCAACIFTSTDLVFGGDNPPYSESSSLGPVNIYGRQKAEAERRMLEANEDVLVCRLPLMFGDAPLHSKTHLNTLIDNLLKSRETALFVDEYRSPVSCLDAAKGILRFIGTNRGVLHLGGTQRVSRYDFGLAVSRALGARDTCIKPCKRKDVVMSAPRPKDVSLDSSKALALGWGPDSIEKALENLECIRTRRVRSQT
jgi:dTDP-4-dehydrorhamnose reductase